MPGRFRCVLWRKTMNYAMYIFDAFADKPFTGNPAVVVLLV